MAEKIPSRTVNFMLQTLSVRAVRFVNRCDRTKVTIDVIKATNAAITTLDKTSMSAITNRDFLLNLKVFRSNETVGSCRLWPKYLRFSAIKVIINHS